MHSDPHPTRVAAAGPAGSLGSAAAHRGAQASTWQRAVRFIKGVLGADKYERYLEFHAASGCGHAPLSRKEFWEEHYRSQDENPGARCC